MRFWNAMRYLHGFGDGFYIPEEAEACRYVYVAIMNKLLTKHRSCYRIVPWDRWFHNTLTIMMVPADLLTDAELAAWNAYLFGELEMPPEGADALEIKIASTMSIELESQTDDGFETAWKDACAIDRDDFIQVKVTILPALQKWLRVRRQIERANRRALRTSPPDFDVAPWDEMD
jgi:hypothetical protein